MIAKTESFSQEKQNSAAAARLLSHPARIAVIQLLSNQQACIPGEIFDSLPLSRGTVNQHLNALKEAGWINTTLHGSKIVYCLNQKKIHQDTKDLRAFLQDFHQALTVECKHLNQKEQ